MRNVLNRPLKTDLLSPATADDNALPSALIQEELRRIVTSRHFRTSRRGKEFLQYVVDQKISGHGDLLKERVIGVELFGRKPDYATGDDPVVRVQAGDVRRRLESYHADPEMHPDVLIQIPLGSYAPTFVLRQPVQEPVPPAERATSIAVETQNSQPVAAIAQQAPNREEDAGRIDTQASREAFLEGEAKSTPQPLTVAGRRVRRLVLIGSAGLALAALVAYFVFAHLHQNPDATTRAFWSPAADASKPVLVCLPRPLVYRPSARLYDEYQKTHPDAFTTREAQQDRILPLLPSDTIQWQDMKPVRDAGISIGAVVAAVNIGKLLEEQGIRFELRFGEEATYADMRVSPVVIVGAINTEWITQLTSESAFAFDDTRGAANIHETFGAHRVWTTEGHDGIRTKDYGLITRQLSGKSGQFLVQIAGITHFGTEAASELLADKKAFAEALQVKPTDVKGKNIQIVVSTDITAGRAGPPHVVAVHTW